MKEIILKPGQYLEKTLVDKICTPTQQAAYHKKERFTLKQQETFFERLARFCEFKHDENTGKYKIFRVFEHPMSNAELKIHQGIYECLTPLIIDRVLNTDATERTTDFSFMELAKQCNMFNSNYNLMKYNQSSVEADLDINIVTTHEYFNKADKAFNYYINKTLEYLRSLNCIIFEPICFIETFTEETTVAKDQSGHEKYVKKRVKDKHIISKEEFELVT